jgi:hypothetical protein
MGKSQDSLSPTVKQPIIIIIIMQKKSDENESSFLLLEVSAGVNQEIFGFSRITNL